jgi:hypothetical protein
MTIAFGLKNTSKKLTALHTWIHSILLIKATIKSATTYLNSFCFFYVLSKKNNEKFPKKFNNV